MTKPSESFYEGFDTAIGTIGIEASETEITSVLFTSIEGQRNPNHLTELCKNQLQEYFSGSRKSFDLPLKITGTDFQKQVWDALVGIPYGETSTYGAQARVINKPKASQAVGSANGKNKFMIILPCHRIVGSDGSLTGYAGGLEAKKWLLDHESANFLR